MNTPLWKAWPKPLCRWARGLRQFHACLVVGLLAGLLLLPVTPAFAQSMAAGERVGRVAAVVGAAQLWDAQDRQWTPLMVNRPLSAGDRIRSEREARVEVQIGTLDVFLGPQTDAELTQLDEQAAQLRLHQGHLVARVRTLPWARALQLVTDELTAQPLTVGLYRLDRDTISGGRSAVAALQGQLSLLGADARMEVAAGQRSEVLGRGSGSGLRSTTLLNDAFAAWVAARDASPLAAPALAVGAPEITGLEALDQHGRWESHPEMGQVWYPVNVRPGWEPFRDGRWVWVRPWGWTWVDDAPWGFAPSNYGRWLQWNSRWVWWPGHGHGHAHGHSHGRGKPQPIRPPAPGHWVGHGAPATAGHDRHGDEWRREGEHRTVRTPRVDGGPQLGSPRSHSPQWGAPGPAVLPPGALAPALTAPPAPPAGAVTMPARDAAVRAGPDRRHGFERPVERVEAPTRVERPEAPSRSDRGERADRPPERKDRNERQDRQRQLAQ